MSDFEQVQILPKQFAVVEEHLNGLHAQLQIVTERLGPVDNEKSIQQTLEGGFKDLSKWLSIHKESIVAGFAIVAEALRETNLPPDKMEVRFVFKVADDHQSESFSIAIGGVTDAEGQPIADTSGLDVKVESSDENVVSVSFDPDSKSGSVSFGSPGVASVTATVTNKKGDILGSGAADFTVTTGDPAAISDVKLEFSGITEEPTEPTPEG
jgi:hypothetical protein